MTAYSGARILPYKGKCPQISQTAFVAAGVCIIGDVQLDAGANIWFNSVLRGDVHSISIGENTNIQDGTICHVTSGKHPLCVGKNVTVGHGAVLHGCTIHDECLIGMGAVILDAAIVEKGAMVAAGAVVTPRTVVKAGELWAGNPARFMRLVKPEEAAYLPHSAQHYVELAQSFQEEEKPVHASEHDPYAH